MLLNKRHDIQLKMDKIAKQKTELNLSDKIPLNKNQLIEFPTNIITSTPSIKKTLFF